MKWLKQLLPVLIGTAILSILLFLNGYPFVYSDTGTYLSSGWELKVPVDRPIAYGLFARIFNGVSLFPLALVQNIITAFIIYQVFLFFFGQDKRINHYYYVAMGLLTTFTSIAWYSNQLMPDFLTPLLFLSLFVLYYYKNLGKVKTIVLVLFTIFCLISHFSHLIIASAFAMVVVLHNFICQRKFDQLKISWRRAILISMVAFSGWLILPTVNFAITGEFYNSKSSHAFFMASMADKGILKIFLRDNCNKPEFSDCVLCDYKDRIPGEVGVFLWEEGDSTAFKMSGGFVDSKKEYNKIIKASLLNPKYAAQHIYKATAYGLIQLLDNDIGSGMGPYRENSSPGHLMNKRYPSEMNMYLNSKQNKFAGYGLNLPLINEMNLKILMFCMILLIYVYSSPNKKSYQENTLFFVSFMIIGIVINSFVTAGLSAPYARYQARVVWIMELSIIIFIIKNWDSIKQRIARIFRINKVD